jgi:hypothetical protein
MIINDELGVSIFTSSTEYVPFTLHADGREMACFFLSRQWKKPNTSIPAFYG